jgi:nitric oxide reductase NorE protein
VSENIAPRLSLVSLRPAIKAIRTEPAGDGGVWVFITADVCMFGLFFTIFIWERFHKVALFEQSRQLLDPNIGLLNTLFLLTSSWFMVGAVHSAREGRHQAVLLFLALTMLAGSGFAVSKIIEYSHKAHMGISMLTNDFFMYYFIFTGIHYLHFWIGMLVLGILWFKARRCPVPSDRECLLWIESGGCYWHMVDLLWLVLFPLLYLLKE